VGSNNINLLMPNGQFGTRLQGGKDAASPRYIFTMLSPLAHHLFNANDTPLLNTLYDDNLKIEPEYYLPIIPMVLVNGADGIGTGWMTKIPNFSPREIVENVRRMIEGEEPLPMLPWYKNFKGEILDCGHGRYACNGEVSILSHNKSIEITELPIGVWTQNYKEGTMEVFSTQTDKQAATIDDYKEYHTDTTVKFIVTMKDHQFQKHEDAGFHKSFKLQSSINLSSMVLFDKNGVLRKYENVIDILKEYFELRMEFYIKRREYMLGLLEAESDQLSAIARFIMEKCDGSLKVENKKKKVILDELIEKK
jgi:DNA topoisomerase-2